MVKVDKRRALGAMLGSAVGDALGAPFEFRPAGEFTKRFPGPVRGPSTEMIGGGMGWAPGEFTDDTQMGVLLGESLLDHGGLDGGDVFERWRRWAEDARDVGSQTRAVLASGDWRKSARRHFERTGHAAGNGSLMRATTSALFAARATLEDSMALAREQSALTHGDPSAGWGAALYHGMIHAALSGDWPLDALATISSGGSPLSTHLATARCCCRITRRPANRATARSGRASRRRCGVLRQAKTFEDAMGRACDVGGDVDTVACVTGGLAGAAFGVQAIPARWLSHVHGHVDGRTYRNTDLQRLALRLVGEHPPALADDLPARGPVEISPGVFAANTLGALTASDDHAVLSFCRVEDRFQARTHRREFFLIDQLDANADLAPVLRDALDEIAAFRDAGIPVVVHCHAGESRTAFVLRAWLMRHEGLSAAEAKVRLAAVWPHMKHHNTDFEAALDQLTF
jgi:ADP-ribosyl-[dinitrogen reductase] hydrolase